MPPAKPAAKRVGRPDKEPHEKKSAPLSLNFGDEDRRRINQAAKDATLDPGVWGRQKLVRVADYELAGLALDVAYDFALERINEKNPARYAAITAALAKAKRVQDPKK